MTRLSGQDLERQREIWQNLYGPATTSRLLEAAAHYAAAHPECSSREVFRAVDPEDEADYVDFVATRW